MSIKHVTSNILLFTGIDNNKRTTTKLILLPYLIFCYLVYFPLFINSSPQIGIIPFNRLNDGIKIKENTQNIPSQIVQHSILVKHTYSYLAVHIAILVQLHQSN